MFDFVESLSFQFVLKNPYIFLIIRNAWNTNGDNITFEMPTKISKPVQLIINVQYLSVFPTESVKSCFEIK